jgi:ribosomal protein S18 acetylase RimI-like enzyme
MSRRDKNGVMELLRTTPEFTHEEILVAEEVIDCYLRDPVGSGYLVFIALQDASIAGYICYGPTPLTRGTWDIYWIAVRPDLRSQGIGAILLRFAEDRIKGNGGRLAIIETSSKDNYEKTRLFYYGLGYIQACTVADFYAPGDDKVILQKRLRPSSGNP